MGRKAKIPSAKLIWNGFLHVTVRTLNSYEQTTNSGISRKAGPLFYANNEPKSALARDLGDCRDNKGKLAKRVFTCYYRKFRGIPCYKKGTNVPMLRTRAKMQIVASDRAGRILFMICIRKNLLMTGRQVN